MNDKLRDIIVTMFKHGYVGARHIPEERLVVSRIKFLRKNLQKEFYKEYHTLLQKNYFIRLKKRTGKGSDWHVSINPEMVEELHEFMEGE